MSLEEAARFGKSQLAPFEASSTVHCDGHSAVIALVRSRGLMEFWAAADREVSFRTGERPPTRYGAVEVHALTKAEIMFISYTQSEPGALACLCRWLPLSRKHSASEFC